MTKTVFITAVSEIDYVKIICDQCSGKLEVPLTGSYPSNCPFYREPFKEDSLNALRKLKDGIRIAKECKDLKFYIQTESDSVK